jgi:pimeloyl-ACP methyl ester carboxylesterase
MNLLAAAAAFLLAISFMAVGVSRVGAWNIERESRNGGAFATVRGTSMHYVHVEAPAKASLPPVVFIHGASSNLRDEMLPIRPLLEGKAEMLFLDRPGYGYSQRGQGNDTPEGQADTIAALMQHLGIAEAVIVGHSFGGAVTAAFALRHPDKVAGLLFLAPATHPWPGGKTSWYYSLTAMPVIGRLFANMIAWPAGSLALPAATASVFAPNPVPHDYVERAAIRLVLRPRAFHANAVDVAGLYDAVSRMAPHYPEIKAPTVIVTGDRDNVVYPEVHSKGLERDIAGSKLLWVHNLGHKPDWVAPELTLGVIRFVAGQKADLGAIADEVEARIAGDRFGPDARHAPTGPAIKPQPVSQ